MAKSRAPLLGVVSPKGKGHGKVTRLWNRLEDVIWLAMLALGLAVAGVVTAILGATLVGLALVGAGIVFALVAD